MEEQKKERTIADIQSEYAGCAGRLGHLEYQIFALSADADMLKTTMRDLNIEAAQLQAKQAAEKAAEKPAEEVKKDA